MMLALRTSLKGRSCASFGDGRTWSWGALFERTGWKPERRSKRYCKNLTLLTTQHLPANSGLVGSVTTFHIPPENVWTPFVTLVSMELLVLFYARLQGILEGHVWKDWPVVMLKKTISKALPDQLISQFRIDKRSVKILYIKLSNNVSIKISRISPNFFQDLRICLPTISPKKHPPEWRWLRAATSPLPWAAPSRTASAAWKTIKHILANVYNVNTM